MGASRLTAGVRFSSVQPMAGAACSS
jgi:hypothetical protein